VTVENPTAFGYASSVPRVFEQVDGFDVKVNRVEAQDEHHEHASSVGPECHLRTRSMTSSMAETTGHATGAVSTA
jgi:hypothetical protein